MDGVQLGTMISMVSTGFWLTTIAVFYLLNQEPTARVKADICIMAKKKDLIGCCGLNSYLKTYRIIYQQGISRPSIYQFPQIADFYNITIQRLLTGKEKDE